MIMLGKRLRKLETEQSFQDPLLLKLKLAADAAQNYNPWFTPDNVYRAISVIGQSISAEKIDLWLQPYRYQLQSNHSSKKVGIVMAGNIPLVGFHDFLCVLISGHHAVCKLSSDDDKLLPVIAEMLFEAEPVFIEKVTFVKDQLRDFDGVIATGSNNTARYFEYYFGKYPHIIRKNRNGVAVLTGSESEAELSLLGKDIFSYFGLGCRSVSKLFFPKNYPVQFLLEALQPFAGILQHHKYNNNYDYYKSIFLVNRDPHLDNGFVLLKEQLAYGSPPAVLYFEYYNQLEQLAEKLSFDQGLIQCIVGQHAQIKNCIPFGQAQKPNLWDYADGVDTMKFLLEDLA